MADKTKRAFGLYPRTDRRDTAGPTLKPVACPTAPSGSGMRCTTCSVGVGMRVGVPGMIMLINLRRGTTVGHFTFSTLELDG